MQHEDFSFIVKILRFNCRTNVPDQLDFLGSGTIIGAKLVVTCRHVIEREDIQELRVATSKVAIHKVKKINLIEPDLALIEIPNHFQENPVISRIRGV